MAENVFRKGTDAQKNALIDLLLMHARETGVKSVPAMRLFDMICGSGTDAQKAEVDDLVLRLTSEKGVSDDIKVAAIQDFFLTGNKENFHEQAEKVLELLAFSNSSSIIKCAAIHQLRTLIFFGTDAQKEKAVDVLRDAIQSGVADVKSEAMGVCAYLIRGGVPDQWIVRTARDLLLIGGLHIRNLNLILSGGTDEQRDKALSLLAAVVKASPDASLESTAKSIIYRLPSPQKAKLRLLLGEHALLSNYPALLGSGSHATPHFYARDR